MSELPHTRPLRVAVYARISRDLAGMRLGVEDQLDRGRTYATSKGYEVVAVSDDNDRSAFRGGHRPGYERVLKLARTGQIDAVVVYQLSRLTRNRRERAGFIEDFGAQGVDIHEVQGAIYNLGTATGRSFADMAGVWATQESDIKTERVRAAVERRVKVGRHTSHPGYGWRSTGESSAQRGYELHPDQARVVQELARAVVAGRPLRALARELNEAGVAAPGAFTVSGEVPKRYRKDHDPATPAPRSYERDDTLDPPTWAAITIKQILARASNVGLLTHNGETAPAAWPPILTDETYSAVIHRLESTKGKGKAAPRAGKRVHLLTMGVAYCGVCGGTLSVAHRKITRKDGSTWVNSAYRCASGKACTQRRVDHLDDFARDALVARMSKPDALAWLAGDEGEASAANEDVVALTRQMEDAADAYADGLVTLGQLKRINEKVAPKLEKAKQRRDAATQHLDLSLLESVAGPRAFANWERMDVAQRRLALEAVGMRIEIGRSKPRGVPLTELDQSTVKLRFESR